MKIVDFNTINSLGISPGICLDWVKESFLSKYTTILPPKVSISQPNNIFINTMPCCIPSISRVGTKVVSRFPKRNPSLQAEILLYNSLDGELLAMMDASWITTMRTGAVAALAADIFRKESKDLSFSIIGLGNTARATLLCLESLYKGKKITVNICAYKDQEQIFMQRFENYKNINFNVFSSVPELFSISDTIISCITSADGILAEDSLYKEGVLVIPVHTRGFQNCDLFFDKVFVDDKEHVKDFRYFNQFKKLEEMSQVLLGNKVGRENNNERILAYNIGIAIHDVFFASKILELNNIITEDISLNSSCEKYWV